MIIPRKRAALLCAAAALLAPACMGPEPEPAIPPPAPPPAAAGPGSPAADSVVVFARLGAPYHRPVRAVELATLNLAQCGSRMREAKTETFPSGSGTVSLPSGHSLAVTGAQANSTFTLVQSADERHLVLEVYVEPAQRFSPPVTLTFNASGCDAPAPGKTRRVVRVRMGSPGTDVGGTPGAGGTFSAQLAELSRYALAEG